MVDWNDYFLYDESSPSCLRWKVSRKGSGPGKPKAVGDVAGEIYEGVPYFQVAVAGKKCYVHRVIWEMHNGSAECFEVDHRNLCKIDNRIGNLRLVPHSKNMRNCKMQHNNTSGVTGVDFDPIKVRWRAKWKDAEGKHRCRSFSLSVYGSEAFDKAVKARQDAIAGLNAAGAGYSNEHGKQLKGDINEVQTSLDAG